MPWRPLTCALAALLLFAAVPLLAEPPPEASPAPAASPAAPSPLPLGGGTLWVDRKGAMTMGVAYPVFRVHSILDRTHKSYAEMLALLERHSAGLAFAHEFVQGQMGGVTSKLAVGLGYVVPFSSKNVKGGQVVLVGFLSFDKGKP
jgi:hypothetical protein